MQSLYSALDTSPFSNYVMHPFWNTVVKAVPRWVAPNMLTFSGFVLLVYNFGVLSYYDPDYTASDTRPGDLGPIPNWVWLVSALCVFGAHTLDGIDGKQARRTGSSSPLGELFDHGIDSWSTLILPTGMYSIFSRGFYGQPTLSVFGVVFLVQFCFLLSHWEKYNTGVLYLPWGYDLGQIGMSLLYLITFLGTIDLWKMTLPIVHLSPACFFTICLYASCVLSALISVFNVYVSYRDNTGHNRTFYEATRPLISSSVLYILFTIWALYSPYDILEKTPRLFYYTCGTTFSNLASRLIVNQMSMTRCQVFNWLLVPLLCVVVLIFAIPLGAYELYFLWAYCLLVTTAHIHYGYSVVVQMADHLGIYSFTITSKPPKKQT
ncbi:unnamed protein product [Owenia fusiformis]|uniref:Uncharacterized protein n=1 Tax=Owenia fusiformis TaxID=6347 RepID=A0A8J1XZL9_OWEFU|nr:unnamed protein product [Owenia fusiformis]